MTTTDRTKRSAHGKRAISAPDQLEGRARVVVLSIAPEVDGGRYPIKRAVGESVDVVAEVVADGHDELDVRLLVRREGASSWREVPMQPLGNDRWGGSFRVDELGRYQYTVRGWIDRFATWRRDLQKWFAAGHDVTRELETGAALVEDAAASAEEAVARKLRAFAVLLSAEGEIESRVELAASRELTRSMRRAAAPLHASSYERELGVVVEPVRAVFSAWYEMFPRSAAAEAGRHGTFRDVQLRLPYVAEMGFDVLYLPPIHPIGTTARKGANNSRRGGPGDPGSPWAIGSREGGHTSVHPELGTLAEFRELVEAARERDIDVALDIAFQTSPDHPWVTEHPSWFRQAPDGTIRHAENPPKKYEDIYPLDFESDDWEALWQGLRDVFLFWLDQGVRVFRVDNPHTKSLRFWEWCIAELKRLHPDVILLSEAFTRPRVMHGLAKIGFSQSYTYFPWRNTQQELRAYLTDLSRPEVLDYFRPNHWTNTPDILTEHLQLGGRPAHFTRVVLAATLGASYGIYGPAFELVESHAVRPGSEEYLDSEKYAIRHWDLDAPGSLRHLIARLNRARRDNRALQSDRGLHFHHSDNDAVICYSKATPERDNAVLVVANLDPHHRHSAWVHLDLDDLGVEQDREFQVHDLISDARYLWKGSSNYVDLDPAVSPAHVFVVRHKVRSESDFEYYL